MSHVMAETIGHTKPSHGFSCWFLAVILLFPARSALGTDWIATGSMHFPRNVEALAMVRLPSDKVFVVGGHPNNVPAEVFDPSSETWSLVATPLGGNFFNPGAVLLDNGEILVCGGQRNQTYTNASELYNPATNEWRITGTMREARERHGLVRLTDGRVLAAGGGRGGGTALSTCELFDPATETWSYTGALMTPRFTGGSQAGNIVLLSNEKILFAGGSTSGNVTLNTCEIYEMASGIWQQTGSMSAARSDYGIVNYTHAGTELVIILGGSSAPGMPVDSCEAYEVATGLWSPFASLLLRRQSAAAVVMSAGAILVAGGSNGSNLLSSCELYNPMSNSWELTSPMAAARAFRNTAALKLVDGRVLVAGLDGSNAASTACEVFTQTVVLNALVDIDPDTLNIKSNGRWITAYITLPAGYDVGAIDHASIAITGLVGNLCATDYYQALDSNFAPQVGDRDEDGIPDLAVKFDRQMLARDLCMDDVTITVEGDLYTGEHFFGSDMIRIISRGK